MKYKLLFLLLFFSSAICSQQNYSADIGAYTKQIMKSAIQSAILKLLQLGIISLGFTRKINQKKL